jgi:hypothetical protein
MSTHYLSIYLNLFVSVLNFSVYRLSIVLNSHLNEYFNFFGGIEKGINKFQVLIVHWYVWEKLTLYVDLCPVILLYLLTSSKRYLENLCDFSTKTVISSEIKTVVFLPFQSV